MAKPKLNKRCKTCGSLLQDKNKSGFCTRHIDRTGVNNPFYGKQHSAEVLEKSRENRREATRKLWRDPIYRESVIKKVSKPRREGFKKEQSERTKKWFENNPEQRELRRKSMSENWKKGIITKNNFSCNRSKVELSFFEELDQIFDGIKPETIHYGESSWLLPDGIIEKDGIVIEFYGNFWHANPAIYTAEDIIHHRLTAQDIWSRDDNRVKLMEGLGFSVYIIWEKEWKENSSQVLNRLDQILNWESCSL